MSDSHEWIPAGPGDSRSPCPALNSLANQGYLPRDGKNITIPFLVGVLRNVYQVSFPFAVALAVGGATMCGNGYKFDLHDLALHNKIEHDASLTHADVEEGGKFAPTVPDAKLLQAMLDSTDRDYLTFDDLVRVRMARDETIVHPFTGTQVTICNGEVALILQVLGDENGHVKKTWVRQWFGEERLPDGWTGPLHPIGILGTDGLLKKVGARIGEIKGKSD
ncbi:Cloroperoxidase [Artomyces pyxidatus]|uniref:Cloroperoxidase n=1 Tax=Artomyces pyxidatus TaxID=48021 RepID=A0ACB8TJU5_9AGAM|nr:Cloroperoxidase [Artomyces pyxidatus]